MVAAGRTVAEVAAETGIREIQVRRCCMMNSVAFDRSHDDVAARILEEVRAGRNGAEVAALLGVPEKMVRDVCARAGVRTSPPRAGGTGARADSPRARDDEESGRERAEVPVRSGMAREERMSANRRRHDRIRSLHESGRTVREISREVGMSDAGVRNFLAREGLLRSTPRPRSSPEGDQEIVLALREGLSRREIAAKTGAKYSRVIRVCKLRELIDFAESLRRRRSLRSPGEKDAGDK